MNKHEKEIFQALTKNPYYSQQELASIVGLSRSTVANILSQLNNNGYIIGKPYELNTKKIITCVGAANIDYKMYTLDKIVYDSSNLVKKTSSLGGVARNIAENLARLGEEVSLMTKVGADIDGQRIIDDTAQLMHVFAIDKLQEYSTGSYTAVIDENRNLAIGLADMQICETMNRDWIVRHKSHLSLSNFIVCDFNLKKDAIDAITEILPQKKIILSGISLSKVLSMPTFPNKIDLFILNKEVVCKYLNEDLDISTENMCKKLQQNGVKSAIISLGEKDFVCYDEEHSPTIVKSFLPKQIKDITGESDAFAAGAIYALSKNKDIITCTKYGAKLSYLTKQTEYSVRDDLSCSIFDDIK